MESATKNRQSAESIRMMAANAFQGLQTLKITELTEGFFNAAYLINLSDGKDVILKIAPPKGSLIMTHEKNMMLAEVESMRLVKNKTDIPIANVLYYDRSHSICNSDYFFMSKIEGKSLNRISDELSEAERKVIDHHVGKLTAQLNSITGGKFGYFIQPDKQSSDWYQTFSGIINDALNDAKALKIDIGVDYGAVSALLSDYKSIFDEVTVPRLVHWDLWAGNIFIKNQEITGLIDFERCLWADELMEVGFRSYNLNEDFLRGYGISRLTDSQQTRIKWYDLYLFLISSLECDYRQYPTYEQLIWARGKIKETVEFLNSDKQGVAN